MQVLKQEIYVPFELVKKIFKHLKKTICNRKLHGYRRVCSLFDRATSLFITRDFIGCHTMAHYLREYGMESHNANCPERAYFIYKWGRAELRKRLLEIRKKEYEIREKRLKWKPIYDELARPVWNGPNPHSGQFNGFWFN